MADTRNGLPEGTDTIIEGGGAGGGAGGTGRSGTTGGSGSPSTATNSTGGRTSTTDNDAGTDSLITGSTSDQGRSLGGAGGTGTGTGSGSTGASVGGSTGGSIGGGSGGSDGDTGGGSGSGIRGMLSTATTKARDEAGTRARGLIGQGLTGSSTALGNVASIIEDTVEQIGERLGPQYADYARTASQTVNRYATTLQDKDPDELVDDARELVRKSPGIALAGAAIVGFGLVRLLKAGVESGGISGSSSDTTGSTSGRKNSQSA
jgi:hypothetical protein